MKIENFTLLEIAEIRIALDNQICENAKLIPTSNYWYECNVRLNSVLLKIQNYVSQIDADIAKYVK